MSQRGGPPIDFEAWAKNQVAKRAKAALEERDAVFAAQYAEAPLSELAQYLIRCAHSLGHSPSPAEIDGGEFIARRFGGWAAAMRAASLPMPASLRKVNETARYRVEKVRQEPLFRAERRRKKQLKHERAEQRRQAQEKQLSEKQRDQK